MEQNTQNKTHLIFLDVLRAIAALYVVLHHAVYQYYDPLNVHLSGFKKVIIQVFFKGHYAVDIFIVISGYSLMLPLLKSGLILKRGAWDFYKRRAKRIIPTYYLAMLFSMMLIYLLINKHTGTHWDLSIPITLKGFIFHLLLIQDFLIDTINNINHAFWSISIETHIYLLFPIIPYLWRKIGRIKTLCISLILCIGIFFFLKACHVYYPLITSDMTGVNPYLILFILGMIAADISYLGDFKISNNDLPWGILLCVMTVLALLFDRLRVKYNIPLQLVDVIWGIWAACLLIASAKCYEENKPNLFNKFLRSKILAFVGTFAYSLYLIHAPILQVFTQYLINPLHLDKFISCLILMSLGTFLIIVLAYLFFLVCERPFFKSRRNEKSIVNESSIIQIK